MAHQIKSLQWPQKTGCLKNLLTNLWLRTILTEWRRSAPARCHWWTGGETGMTSGQSGELGLARAGYGSRSHTLGSLPNYLHDCLAAWLSGCLTVCLTAWLPECLSDCLTVWLSDCVSPKCLTRPQANWVGAAPQTESAAWSPPSHPTAPPSGSYELPLLRAVAPTSSHYCVQLLPRAAGYWRLAGCGGADNCLYYQTVSNSTVEVGELSYW